ncbi:MAG: hypothetical protein HOH74_15335, partial [Gemmatimonadetes bacterium]|nr:hypothetical protein [Gemmatimonadota bacterium]
PDADTLNFGTVLRGKSAQLHLILDNTGTIPVRGAVAIDDPSFVVEPERFTVEPGLSQELAITFSPARAVNHVARLRFLDVEPFVGPALTIDSIPVLGFASPLVVADFNGDRVVDMDDFFAFAEVAFKELTPESAAFDLTRDGRIDFADLFRFSDLFGEVMPVILGRSTELDPVSQEYLSLYGRAIRALTADLANGIVRPGETVRDTRSGRATELVIDIELPDELETLHFENDEATLDGLSADLVITGSSQLPGGLTPLRNEPDTRLPDSPVTDVPVGFVTSDGEELAVHGNVVTLPRARARFDYGRLRSSDEPTMQEAIQEIRAFRPELTQETIDVHCNGGGYVSVDKVFSELYDSGLPGAPVEELYWVLATNNVTYDCETQKYAANFMLQYLRSVRSGNEPVVSEEFIVSESLQR